MNQNPHIPTALKVLATMFILMGIYAVIEVIVSALNNTININFGVLGLFIGPGLLAFRPGWRTCALVFIKIALVIIPIFAVLLLFHNGPLDVKILGQKVGYTSKVYGYIMVIVVFSLSRWQYQVLNRPEVRSLFGLSKD